MEQREIFESWKRYFNNNKVALRQLNKLEGQDLVNIGFFDNFKFSNKRIYAKLGIGYNCVNELSLNRLVYALIMTLNSNSQSNNILISSDGTLRMVDLIKSISTIKTNKFKFLAFDNYGGFDEKIVSMATRKIKPTASIHIQHSSLDSELIEIIILDVNGKRFDNEFLELVLDKSIQYSGFDINLDKNNHPVFVDTDLIINVFSEKIISLYTKNISTKKTKITISNHNDGVTKIFAKLIGKLDYSYVINDKPKPKLHKNKKVINDAWMKRKYNDEIRFARKKGSNFLITFNEDGTQLYMFCIYKNHSIFLNENLITLIFLNEFANKLQINNTNIGKYYLSSNTWISWPINKICTKYNIEFKINENNEIITSDDKYMLIYWNTYSQFAFGEFKNDCYSIYHISLKILEIVNYQHLQHHSIKPLLNDLEKMYDSDHETKVFLNYDFKELIEKMNEFIKTNEINKHFKLIYQNQDKKYSEEIMAYVFDYNGYNIVIKYNFIINQLQIFIRSFNGWNFINTPIQLKKIIEMSFKIPLKFKKN